MTTEPKIIDRFSCPVPRPVGETVVLGHGSGGLLSNQLVRDVFLSAFDNPVLARLDDQAVIQLREQRIALTTDSFVVRPLFFPGGDIGSLAVHGTVNDLAMAGAKPLVLSAAFIIEEGLPMDVLRRIVASLGAAAADVGVDVVTGDTKVVDRGSCDALFINTSGIGIVPEGVSPSANRAVAGDRIVVSGPLGEHGIAVMAAREQLQFHAPVESDSAALHTLVDAIVGAVPDVHCLRDPTRGGLSSALNEIAEQSRVGMVLDEVAIPVPEVVRGACELLGLDPLYVANEGKLIAVVAGEDADRVLTAMRAHPRGREAQVIGTVTDDHPSVVAMKTAMGTRRIVDMLAGDQLPRIC